MERMMEERKPLSEQREYNGDGDAKVNVKGVNVKCDDCEERERRYKLPCKSRIHFHVEMRARSFVPDRAECRQTILVRIAEAAEK